MYKILFNLSVNDKFFIDCIREVDVKGKDIQFYGIAYVNYSYIQKANFKKILDLSSFTEAEVSNDLINLLEIESKYNIILADLIRCERHFDKLSKSKKIQYALYIIKLIEELHEEENIDLVFSEGLDDFTSYFLKVFCKKNNIPFRYFITNRLGSTVYLSDRYDTGPVNLEDIFIKNKNLYAKDQNKFIELKKSIKSYIDNKSQPYYINSLTMKYSLIKKSDVMVFTIALKKYFENKNGLYANVNPLLFPFFRVKRILRKIEYRLILNNGNQINIEQLAHVKYLIFPLHLHPEAATLIQGRWFNNQLVIIEMISKCLPVDTILVVKEHIVSIGRRSSKFYKFISELHNVYFIHENTSIYTLLEKSKGIVTISSSMGIEAILLNKPIISFGDIHYNILKQVIKARDFSIIPKYIEELLNFKGYDEVELWGFLKSISDNCFDMSGFDPHNYSVENVKEFNKIFNNLIYEKYNKKINS